MAARWRALLPERIKAKPKLSATTDAALRPAMTCGKSWISSIQDILKRMETYMNTATQASMRAMVFEFMVMAFSSGVLGYAELHTPPHSCLQSDKWLV